jgi:hypothetical protein
MKSALSGEQGDREPIARMDHVAHDINLLGT